MNEFPSAPLLLMMLKNSGFSTRKRLGQHFLADEDLLTKIADSAGADAQTLVVEIGSGPATLTTLLRERAGGLLGIEQDRRMKPFHEKVFSQCERVEFIYDDALKLDLRSLAQQRLGDWELQRAVLAGNIPFQITSPLLFGQLGPGVRWARMALMVQRELADRIAASPGTKDYGILSVKLAYWWKIVERFEVPSEMFTPRPKVDATTLVFAPTARGEKHHTDHWGELSTFIDLSFNQRRKKLYNSPAAGWVGGDGRKLLRNALEAMGLNPDARAENLSPSEFLDLFGRIRTERHPMDSTSKGFRN